MAISNSEALARAVAEDLQNANSQFAISFLAKYDPLPTYDLKDLDVPKVNVRDLTQSLVDYASRSQTEHDYNIEVIARVKLAKVDSNALSMLKLFGEQLMDKFRFTKPTGRSERLRRVDGLSIAPDADLDQQHVGKVSMTLVFVGWRD